MLKKVSFVFLIIATLGAAIANAQDRMEPSAMQSKVITARKVVLDPTKKLDVVDTANEAGSFSKLSSLLKKPSLWKHKGNRTRHHFCSYGRSLR